MQWSRVLLIFWVAASQKPLLAKTISPVLLIKDLKKDAFRCLVSPFNRAIVAVRINDHCGRGLVHDRPPKAQPVRKRSGKRTADDESALESSGKPLTEGDREQGLKTHGFQSLR